MNIDLIHLLYPIQYELWFLYTTLVWPGAGAETSLYRLQLRLRPKVSAPYGSNSGSLRLQLRLRLHNNGVTIMTKIHLAPEDFVANWRVRDLFVI